MPLVLTRHEDEGVVVTVPPSSKEQTIRLFVSSIRRDRVRIAFDALPEISIHRDEVQARINGQADARAAV